MFNGVLDCKNIFKVTFVIIGTIIGAGFASGQEILIFFNNYGFYGLIGLIFSIILFQESFLQHLAFHQLHKLYHEEL